MDTQLFDRLARSLASGSSRRILLAWMATGLTPLLARSESAQARRKHKKKKKNAVVSPPVSPPPISPPTECIPACGNRVCGPDSCGGGSCGDCGLCKSCEGGACFNKTNGTACGGECLECQAGACVAKKKGTSCSNGVCTGSVCCPSGKRVCGETCCAAGTVCIDSDNGRCAPDCDAACNSRRPRCGCALPFDRDVDYCNVNGDSGVICAQPDCDSQADCAPDKVCSNVSCGGVGLFHKCLEACPA